MEFDLFEKTFYEALKGSMEPEGTGVFQAPIYKNGVLLPGFILRRTGSGAGVTINIRDYYEKWEAGQNLDELVFDVKNEILFKKIPEFDFHDLSREKAEESIISCVVGYEKNQAWLKNFPHERIQDMAVYARWQLTDEVSFPVSDMVMSSIKMTKEEMLAVAKANHKKKASFNLLEDILFHLSGPSKAEFNGAFDLPGSNAIAPMYILGNQSGIQGAAVAMDPEVLLAVKKCLQAEKTNLSVLWIWHSWP